jgi:hypothetical protein
MTESGVKTPKIKSKSFMSLKEAFCADIWKKKRYFTYPL